MAVTDYLTMQNIQMAVVVLVTLGFHYYFISNRFASNEPPAPPITPIEDYDKTFN